MATQVPLSVIPPTDPNAHHPLTPPPSTSPSPNSSSPPALKLESDQPHSYCCNCSERRSVSVWFVFVVTGIIALFVAIAVGLNLYGTVVASAQDLTFQIGVAQAANVAGRIQSQFNNLENAVRYTYGTLAATPFNASTNDGLRSQLEPVFLANFVSTVARENGIDGMEIAIMLPKGTNMTLNQTTALYLLQVYADSLRDGTRTLYYAYTFDDYGNATHVMNVTVDPDTSAMTSMTYMYDTPEWLPYYNQDPNLGKGIVWGPPYGYAAADGTPYYYWSIWRTVQIRDYYVEITCYQVVGYWRKIISDAIGFDSDVLVIDGIDEYLLATNIAEENARLDACYRNRYDFIQDVNRTCLAYTPRQSNSSYVSGLYLSAYDPSWGVMFASVPTRTFIVTVAGASRFIVSQQLSNEFGFRVFLIWSRNADSVLGPLRSQAIVITVVACVLIGAVTFITVVASYFALLRPMKRMSARMEHLTLLQIDEAVRGMENHSRFTEVRTMEEHFHAMARAIRSFTSYVPRDVVKDLLFDGGGVATVGLASFPISCMFVDVVNFTTFCETLIKDTDTLSKLLSLYFQQATVLLLQWGATIDKFMGDAIMALWGAPLDIDAREFRAIGSALDLVHHVNEHLKPEFNEVGIALAVRVGINSGDALCGNIGSVDRINYTALGDTVNVASRLEALNKHYHSSICVRKQTYDEAAATCASDMRFIGRVLGNVVVKGKTEAYDVVEVFGVDEPLAIISDVGGLTAVKSASSLLGDVDTGSHGGQADVVKPMSSSTSDDSGANQVSHLGPHPQQRRELRSRSSTISPVSPLSPRPAAGISRVSSTQHQGSIRVRRHVQDRRQAGAVFDVTNAVAHLRQNCRVVPQLAEACVFANEATAHLFQERVRDARSNFHHALTALQHQHPSMAKHLEERIEECQRMMMGGTSESATFYQTEK